MKEGLWAESEASGWRKAESKASGCSGRQDQVGGWMGGVSSELVKRGRSQQANGRIVYPRPDREQDEPTGTMSNEQEWKTTSRWERSAGKTIETAPRPVLL